MARFIRRTRVSIVLTAVLCFLQVYPPFLSADESAVKMVKLEGSINRTGPGPIFPFALSGVASHLGTFTGVGEVAFVPGPQPDSETGSGVVVFTAVNGDKLVGVVTWDITASENDTHDGIIRFAWRDSVTLSNGVVSNTGRFVTDRPPGLVVITKCILVYNPITNTYSCVWVLAARK